MAPTSLRLRASNGSMPLAWWQQIAPTTNVAADAVVTTFQNYLNDIDSACTPTVLRGWIERATAPHTDPLDVSEDSSGPTKGVLPPSRGNLMHPALAAQQPAPDVAANTWNYRGWTYVTDADGAVLSASGPLTDSSRGNAVTNVRWTGERVDTTEASKAYVRALALDSSSTASPNRHDAGHIRARYCPHILLLRSQSHVTYWSGALVFGVVIAL
jgi:hypothetical protein